MKWKFNTILTCCFFFIDDVSRHFSFALTHLIEWSISSHLFQFGGTHFILSFRPPEISVSRELNSTNFIFFRLFRLYIFFESKVKRKLSNFSCADMEMKDDFLFRGQIILCLNKDRFFYFLVCDTKNRDSFMFGVHVHFSFVLTTNQCVLCERYTQNPKLMKQFLFPFPRNEKKFAK